MKKARIFSMFLALAMVLTCMSAFAEPEVNELPIC